MFCQESLGEIKCGAFLKRARPQILSIQSAYYFGASEHYWGVEKNKNLNYKYWNGQEL